MYIAEAVSKSEILMKKKKSKKRNAVYFQSLMVSEGFSGLNSPVFLFQFLCGTIKSLQIPMIVLTWKSSFNSSTVQLKVSGETINGVNILMFQFLYGTIKRCSTAGRSVH